MTAVGVTFPKATGAITIALGEATTAQIDLGGQTLVGISTPTELTNSTVSVLAARVSGGTFKPIYNDAGTAVAITVATNAARMIGLDTNAMAVAPFRFIKLQTGIATSSATEAATRTFYLITK